MTTKEAIAASSDKNVPVLFRPKKLLGDYDVSAGLDGTPEVTQKYLNATPGQKGLNTSINTYLEDKNNMDTSYTSDTGSKLKSFDEFPITRHDLIDAESKASANSLPDVSVKSGDVTHPALKGTNKEPPTAATTVEMNGAKERALKRLNQFVDSYHGNNQETTYTKEVV